MQAAARYFQDSNNFIATFKEPVDVANPTESITSCRMKVSQVYTWNRRFEVTLFGESFEITYLNSPLIVLNSLL